MVQQTMKLLWAPLQQRHPGKQKLYDLPVTSNWQRKILLLGLMAVSFTLKKRIS